MIRHSSSLFISLVIHLFLLFTLFYTYTTFFKEQTVKKTTQKRMLVQLCNIQTAQEVKKVQAIKKQETKPLKKTKPKPKPKLTLKPKPKPKPKQIKILKKIIPKKEPALVVKKQKEMKINEEIPKIKKETHQDKSIRLEKEYLSEHIKAISKLLEENLYYPRSARKRGITGVVIVRFKLSTQGKVYSIEVLESKSEILSRAALQTIQNVANEFPHPPETLTLHVPIKYQLR